MCQRTLEVTLADADPSCDGQQSIKVVPDHHGVSIVAKGYGDRGSADGHGSPMFLELYRGRLRLLVWADINVEDPTHVIDLEDSREDRRHPQEP